LDESLQPDTRRELLEQANELCQEQPIYDFVQTRFFNNPMPKAADLLTALELSQPYDLVAKIYQDWLCAKLKEAWEKVLPQKISVKEKREAINQQITAKNLFPQLATAFGHWAPFHQLLQQIELPAPQAKIIIELFQQRLTALTHIKIPPYAPPPQARLLTELKNFAQTHQTKYQSTKRWKFEQVKNYLQEIKNNLRHRQLKQAQQTTETLIDYQISHNQSIPQAREKIAKSLSNLAYEAMKYHHFTLAHQWLDYAEIVDEKNAVIKTNRAELLKAEGKFSQALAVYQQTMAQFPKDAVARTGYAELLKLQGEYSQALAVYQQTIAQFPKDAVARTGYAELLKLQGDYSQALAVYQQTMAQFPKDAVARNGYANTLVAHQEYAKAREYLPQQAKELRTPDDWIGFHIFAMSYLREGEVELAIRYLKEGLYFAPKNQQSYFKTALAVAYLQQQQADADAALEIIQETSAPTPMAQAQQALLTAHCYLEKQDLEQAEQALQQAAPVAQTHHLLKQVQDKLVEVVQYFKQGVIDAMARVKETLFPVEAQMILIMAH